MSRVRCPVCKFSRVFYWFSLRKWTFKSRIRCRRGGERGHDPFTHMQCTSCVSTCTATKEPCCFLKIIVGINVSHYEKIMQMEAKSGSRSRMYTPSLCRGFYNVRLHSSLLVLDDIVVSGIWSVVESSLCLGVSRQDLRSLLWMLVFLIFFYIYYCFSSI